MLAGDFLGSLRPDGSADQVDYVRHVGRGEHPASGVALAVAWPGRAMPAITVETAGNPSSQPKASSSRLRLWVVANASRASSRANVRSESS